MTIFAFKQCDLNSSGRLIFLAISISSLGWGHNLPILCFLSLFCLEQHFWRWTCLRDLIEDNLPMKERKRVEKKLAKYQTESWSKGLWHRYHWPTNSTRWLRCTQEVKLSKTYRNSFQALYRSKDQTGLFIMFTHFLGTFAKPETTRLLRLPLRLNLLLTKSFDSNFLKKLKL